MESKPSHQHQQQRRRQASSHSQAGCVSAAHRAASGGSLQERQGCGCQDEGEAASSSCAIPSPDGQQHGTSSSSKCNQNSPNSRLRARRSAAKPALAPRSTDPSGSSCNPAALPTLMQEQVTHVQSLIERCMQRYMTKAQVVTLLQQSAGVDPQVTLSVWGKLEERNPDFFSLYHTRTKLKDQISLFNHLLNQQVCIVQELQQAMPVVGQPPATAHGTSVAAQPPPAMQVPASPPPGGTSILLPMPWTAAHASPTPPPPYVSPDKRGRSDPLPGMTPALHAWCAATVAHPAQAYARAVAISHHPSATDADMQPHARPLLPHCFRYSSDGGWAHPLPSTPAPTLGTEPEAPPETDLADGDRHSMVGTCTAATQPETHPRVTLEELKALYASYGMGCATPAPPEAPTSQHPWQHPSQHPSQQWEQQLPHYQQYSSEVQEAQEVQAPATPEEVVAESQGALPSYASYGWGRPSAHH